MLIILGTTALAFAAQDLPPPKGWDKFLHAIHTVETSGRTSIPDRKDTNGKISRGPFQIQKDYWKDARTLDLWEQCKLFEPSSRVVRAYMIRYERHAYRLGNWEAMARCHNGGCGWRKHKKATDKYWAKVKKAMEAQ